MNWTFLLQTFLKCLGGIPTTFLMALLTLLCSSPLAFCVALIRNKRIPVLQKICSVYVSFIRGTPIILQIYLVYNILPSILNVLFQKWELSIEVFEVNPLLYAVVVFTLNITATMSEVIRSSLSTIDKGQHEAAVCAGLNEFQAYIRIIIPQALVSAIPNLCSLLVGLVQMTSLAFIMTVQDITAIAKIEAGRGFNYIEAYLDIFVIYLAICIAIEKVFGKLEKRLRRYKAA